MCARYAEGKLVMAFDLFWMDFWIRDKLFGFGILSLKKEDFHKSLLAIYWDDGEILIDLFWFSFRIFTTYPFWEKR